MASSAKVIKETEVQTDNATHRVTEVDDPVEQYDRENTLAQQVVWYIWGVIVTLLGLRFIFAMLGANQNNWLAEFVYNVTSPLVAPFTNLFSYDGVQYGVSRFELFTIVAILFYTLVAFGISKLFTLSRQ